VSRADESTSFSCDQLLPPPVIRRYAEQRSTNTIPTAVLLYLAAFAAALLVDTVPVFAPPAWMILAFIIVKWKPNPWGIIAAGRHRLGHRPLPPHALHAAPLHQNLPPLGERQPLLPREELGGRFWKANTFVMLYAISPLSTTALFTAAAWRM
jgi:hypothetical protein